MIYLMQFAQSSLILSIIVMRPCEDAWQEGLRMLMIARDRTIETKGRNTQNILHYAK